MAQRPADQPDINPARLQSDPLLALLAEMVAYVDLHIGTYPIQQLTTAQKELWADLCDSASAVVAFDDESMWPPSRNVRWWRDDYDGPTGPEDPRWHDHTHREPDPFAYADPDRPDAQASRAGEPESFDPPNETALQIARTATMVTATTGPSDPHHVHLLEDQTAVYLWAMRQVRSVVRTDGEVGAWRAFPSPSQAKAYLTAYRATRGR